MQIKKLLGIIFLTVSEKRFVNTVQLNQGGEHGGKEEKGSEEKSCEKESREEKSSEKESREEKSSEKESREEKSSEEESREEKSSEKEKEIIYSCHLKERAFGPLFFFIPASIQVRFLCSVARSGLSCN